MKKLSFFALCAFMVSSLTFTACEPEGDNTGDTTEVKLKDLTDYAEELAAKDSYTRDMVLVEQFTSVGCQYCPGGAAQLKASIEALANPKKVSWIAHHILSFGADKFNIEESSKMWSFVKAARAPAAMIDRKAKYIAAEKEEQIIFHPGYTTKAMLEEALAIESEGKVIIEHSFDPKTSVLKMNVMGVSNEAAPKLTVFLVEDGFSAKQADHDTQGYIDYTHNNVPRHYFTDWSGDAVTLDANKQFIQSYMFKVPAELSNLAVDASKVDIVAFISKPGITTEAATIINVARVDLIKATNE